MGSGCGVAGARIAGLVAVNSEQALGGAGGELHLAPDFRQRAERRGGERRIDDELAERAAGEAAEQHILGAEPENADHGTGRDEDDGAGQERAREGAAAGGRKERSVASANCWRNRGSWQAASTAWMLDRASWASAAEPASAS